MTIDKALTLDLNRVQPHKVIKIHEGDVNSVFLMLTVTKDGAAVSLSGLTIKYDATIAGYLAEQDASGSVSSGKIRIPITKNMTALPGTLKIDIKMKSGTEVLYTQTVTMIVDKSVVDGSTIIDFDGTTIGGRLNALEAGFEDVKLVVRALNSKFPLDADDIKDNEVMKVESISSSNVDNALKNNVAYGVLLEGRSNLLFCVNSGTNLRAQVRIDTLGYMKYRSQTKHDDVWDDWTAWTPIASNMNMADGAVTSSKLGSGAVTTAKIADNAVTGAKIADNAILPRHLSDGAVDTDAIDVSAVTTNEIANGAVTTAKLATDAVTGAKIADRAVGTAHIALLAVTEPTLATGAVTELKLADNAVTTSKIKDANISSQKLMNLIISTAKIIDGAVTTAKIADGSVTTAKLADNAVTSDKIADGAVTVDKIPSEEITAEKLAPGSVTTSQIEFNAVTSAELANGAVITAKIADGAVTAEKLASGVLPTKTSDLQNDSGFLTQHQDISGLMLYAPVVNTAQQVSALHAGQLFIYQSEVCVKTNDDYIHLAKLSQIPSKTSDLTNDSGFLTQHQDISGKADKATTLAGYGITNAYSKSEIDGVFMELAPDTNPGSISILEDGQLFRCQGAVALKTGNSADYIELAKKSIVPTKTSDLQNDSGFVSDLTEYMRLAHTTSPEDSGQFYLDRVGLSQNAVNLYLSLYNSESKRVAWYSDLPDISGKADIESGTVPSNHAWYTQEGDGYTMTGNYTIIGNMCFLRATAYLIQGWERVYYSLPVAATASASTIALHNDGTFTIATGTQSNISVLEIRQIGSQYMSTGGTISFTLVYKCS